MRPSSDSPPPEVLPSTGLPLAVIVVSGGLEFHHSWERTCWIALAVVNFKPHDRSCQVWEILLPQH